MGKKNMSKAIEGMQGALEQESKGKAEALRMKKKLESDVGELEIALEHSNANNLETQKAIKKYQGQIREAAGKLDEEQRSKEVARDSLVAAQKRASSMQMPLRKLGLCLNKLTAKGVPLNKNWLMSMRACLMLLSKIKPLLLLRGSSSLKCRLCMLIWMK